MLLPLPTIYHKVGLAWPPSYTLLNYHQLQLLYTSVIYYFGAFKVNTNCKFSYKYILLNQTHTLLAGRRALNSFRGIMGFSVLVTTRGSSHLVLLFTGPRPGRFCSHQQQPALLCHNRNVTKPWKFPPRVIWFLGQAPWAVHSSTTTQVGP